MSDRWDDLRTGIQFAGIVEPGEHVIECDLAMIADLLAERDDLTAKVERLRHAVEMASDYVHGPSSGARRRLLDALAAALTEEDR